MADPLRDPVPRGGALEAVAQEIGGLAAGYRAAEPAAAPEPVPQDKLEVYKKMFAQAREGTLDSRRLNQVSFDYYDNKQWTSEEIRALRKRKQPEIWTNRIQPAVDGILGVLEQGQTDPRGLPRNGQDMAAAEIATDSLRYAAERARWPRTKLGASKDFLIGGTGAVIVGVDDQGDPWPRQIRWEEFFADPHSRDADYEDARYMGIAKWMYVDLVKDWFKLADDVDVKDFASGSQLAFDESDEDKPKTIWADRKNNRVLVVEMYHNDKGWKRCVFHGGAVLEYGDSPYLDEGQPGRPPRPMNPIVAQSCYVDRENQRYGVVRSMVPIQDEINMRRSRALHAANTRRVRQTDMNAAGDVNTVRDEAARPDGVIPFGWDVVGNDDIWSAQMALLQESKSEIERKGPNPAVLGRQGADSSGKAQLIRQQAGLIELTPALGGIADLELRVYRQMWARIRQFWTEPKWVRVTDDIGAPKFLQVNEQRVTGRQVVMGPDGQPTIQPIIEVVNRPAEMDMDIIIDATPDTANLQQEQFQELVRLAGIYGPTEVPFDDLLEASSLPKKRQLLEKRQSRQQQQTQQPLNPMQQADFQAKLENTQADTEGKRAKAIKDQVAAQGEAQQQRRLAEEDAMRKLVTFGPGALQFNPPPQGPAPMQGPPPAF